MVFKLFSSTHNRTGRKACPTESSFDPGAKPEPPDILSSDGLRRCARRSRRLQDLVSGAPIVGGAEPCQRHDRREFHHRHRLKEGERSEMAELAAVAFRVRMFECQRSRLRANYSAQKQHDKDKPRAAATAKHRAHSSRASRP